MVARTFEIKTGNVIREATGWMYPGTVTVILPSEFAAYFLISEAIQSRAAPIPRVVEFCVDKVCLVPNETSFSMLA